MSGLLHAADPALGGEPAVTGIRWPEQTSNPRSAPAHLLEQNQTIASRAPVPTGFEPPVRDHRCDGGDLQQDFFRGERIGDANHPVTGLQ
jgi:hypothetical protein